MNAQRLTGPGAGAVKYDIVTSLSVVGLNSPPVMQTSMMRLISLISARYNWQLDEFCVGQREMARMWSVSERTVKREIKRLVDSGMLICKRAGVRGRVGAYRLNYRRIAEASEHIWPLVGPDFDSRMRTRYAPSTAKVVVLKDFTQNSVSVERNETGPWPRTLDRLKAQDPDVFQAWFSRLTHVDFKLGVLQLSAPSPFAERYIETHLLARLIEAAAQEFGCIRSVEFCRPE